MKLSDEKLSILALALSGLTLLVVLFTPTPGPPDAKGARDVERLILMVEAEMLAAADNHKALDAAFANVEEMRTRLKEQESGSGPDPIEFAEKTALKEINQRWREFESRMKVIESIRASKEKK